VHLLVNEQYIDYIMHGATIKVTSVSFRDETSNLRL